MPGEAQFPFKHRPKRKLGLRGVPKHPNGLLEAKTSRAPGGYSSKFKSQGYAGPGKAILGILKPRPCVCFRVWPPSPPPKKKKNSDARIRPQPRSTRSTPSPRRQLLLSASCPRKVAPPAPGDASVFGFASFHLLSKPPGVVPLLLLLLLFFSFCSLVRLLSKPPEFVPRFVILLLFFLLISSFALEATWTTMIIFSSSKFDSNVNTNKRK